MVLVLKALRNDHTSYNGFQYPTGANDIVTAPDWDPSPTVKAGGGLYGFKNAVGDDKHINMALKWSSQGHWISSSQEWLVLEVDENSIIDTDGVARFESGRVVFRSNNSQSKIGLRPYLSQYTNYILSRNLDTQNSSGNPIFVDYVHDIPMLGINISFSRFAGSTSSPYDQANVPYDIWTLIYYDEFSSQSVTKEYVFQQDELIFGPNTRISGGLHGSNHPNGKKITVGARSDVAIHANGTRIVAGEFSDVTCGLAFTGYSCTVDVARFCEVVTEKDCIVTMADFCTLSDRGLGRVGEVEDGGRLAVRATCADYCAVELNLYSTITAGDRCKIEVQRNCVVTCGVGCFVTVFGATRDTAPASYGRSKVKGKKGTVVTYTPDIKKPNVVYQWVVGLADSAIKEDVFYHVNLQGEIVDDLGTVIPPQNYNFNSGAGGPIPNLDKATGPRSFFYNLDQESGADFDREELDIRDRLTGTWRKFYKGFGP